VTEQSRSQDEPCADLPYHARLPEAGEQRAQRVHGHQQRSKRRQKVGCRPFCPPQFTITQLRRVYEAVWGTTLDPRNFHRKVTRTPGFLSPAGAATAGRRSRPAQLYCKGPATLLYPPMLRGSS
jgi:hypothetical protein